MPMIDPVCRAVIEKAEWVAIATTGPDGPHLAATWGDYIRALNPTDTTLLIPAGLLKTTERNLAANPRLQLLFASRQVQGAHGPGKGCCITARGEFAYSGPAFEQTKAKFPWARAVLIAHVESAEGQL